MVALLTSVRNSPCFGGLRRTKTCHWQLFARPSTCFLVTFCTTQKVTIRFPCRELRGFPNLESAHPNNTLPRTKINPLPLCLLETWSPCSRPFAILPVSAVSDAQKLATGNFLHVRACFCGTFCTPQKVPIRFPFGKFEVLQTLNQPTQTTTSH